MELERFCECKAADALVFILLFALGWCDKTSINKPADISFNLKALLPLSSLLLEMLILAHFAPTCV